MMTNRKLPFGYRMEQGQAVIHPQEAEPKLLPFSLPYPPK